MAIACRPFGQGPQVSVFTLGTMRALGSVQQMYDVAQEAFFAGINHIETAPAYGPAEVFLGKVLQRLSNEGKVPSNGWIITSKLLPGLSFKEGQRQLLGILSRVGISKIDNLAIHGINIQSHLDWALKGEGSDLIRWAFDESLIGQIGFSSHGSQSLIKRAIESDQFQFCSLHVHLLDPEKIPLAKLALRNGMGVMAISPADKGGRLQDPSQTLISDCDPIPPIQLAYRFLLAEGISTLTLGASQPNDLELAKNLANNDTPLTSVEQNSISNLRIKAKQRLGKTFCGQCRSCLPCPKDVPIPELLRLRNLALGHDLMIFSKERYNLIGKAGHWWEQINANECARCQQCLPRCPNNLSIPDLLEETHSLLSDAPERRLWG